MDSSNFKLKSNMAKLDGHQELSIASAMVKAAVQSEDWQSTTAIKARNSKRGQLDVKKES